MVEKAKDLVVTIDDLDEENGQEMNLLELLAIQALMNPAVEESDEEEFLWAGK
jgi:hypothetical protein